MSPKVPLSRYSPAALALATGQSVNDAAAASGVDRRTLTRWQRSPVFQAKVAEYRGELVRAALGRVVNSLTSAADTLRGLMNDGDPATQLSAAKALFAILGPLQDRVDFDARLAAVERRSL